MAKLSQLSPSKAQFALPPLDEHSPGVERLLGSLKEGLLISSARGAPIDTPSKKRHNAEEDMLDLHQANEEDATVVPEEKDDHSKETGPIPAAEQSIWTQAALAGPSRVEVSRDTVLQLIHCSL